jgi:hypothetical protein
MTPRPPLTPDDKTGAILPHDQDTMGVLEIGSKPPHVGSRVEIVEHLGHVIDDFLSPSRLIRRIGQSHGHHPDHRGDPTESSDARHSSH